MQLKINIIVGNNADENMLKHESKNDKQVKTNLFKIMSHFNDVSTTIDNLERKIKIET